MQKYGTAIQDAQAKMDSAQKRQQEYTQKLDAAKQKHSELQGEIARVKSAMEQEAAANGKSSERYQQLAQELEQLEAEYKDNEAAIKGWERGIAKADQAMANADKNVQKYTTAQNEAKAAIGRMESELDGLNRNLKNHVDDLKRASQALQDFGDKAKAAGQWQTSIGNTMNKATTAITAAGAASVGAAIQWESSCADVEKTVSGTQEQLEALEQGLLEMSKTKPIDNTTLADIAANAGQLGIWTENVLGFTDVMSDLANTTNLTADEGASAFAKFANITGMAQTNFDRLGSVVVDLGNNMATTEKDIVSMATNLASAGHQVGMSEADIMGIAAGLSSLGLEAQAGGTAFSKLFINMGVAAETGSDDLKKFAEVAGMSASEFKTAFETDAAGAVTSFIQGLSSGSQSAIAILDDMGIKETRFRDALLRTSSASGLFSNAIDLANRAWQENTALANEAAVRYNTTASQITMLGNKAKAAAINFGNDLMPMVREGIGFADGMLDKFNSLDSAQRQQIMTWAAYVAAVGPAFTVLGKANTAVGNVATGLGKLAGVAAEAGGGLKGLAAVAGQLLGPVGIAAVAVAAGVLVYKFAEWASGAKAAREAQERLNETVREWEQNVTTAYERSKGLAGFGLTGEDFAIDSDGGAGWLKDTLATWTDGKRETDQIVSDTVKGFTDGTDKIRTALKGLKDSAGGGTVGDLDGDLEKLDAIDKQVEGILKKRQNGTLTEDDTAQRQSLMDQRDAIKVKYQLVSDTDSAFDQITRGVDAALARDVEGKDAWADAYAAANQGIQAYTDSLNQEFDARHRVISAMEDGAEKEKQLGELKTWYNEQATKGQEKYGETLAKAAEATGAFAKGGAYDGALQGIQQVEAAMEQLAAASGEEEITAATNALNESLAGLDETQVVEMTAALTSMKTAGAGMDASMTNALTALSSIKDLLSGKGDTFDNIEGLDKMFGSGLDQEVLEINATLNTETLNAAYDAWAAGGHADIIPQIQDLSSNVIELPAQITELGMSDEDKSIDLTGNVDEITWPEGSTFVTDGEGRITKVTTPSGSVFEADGEGRIGKITTPAGITFETDGEGRVVDVKGPEGTTFQTDGDGYVTSVTTAEGVTYSVDGEGRVTQVTTPSGLTFETDGEGRVVDVKGPQGTTFETDGEGNVTTVTTGDGVTFSVDNGSGVITSVTVDPGVVPPTIQVPAEVTYSNARGKGLEAGMTKGEKAVQQNRNAGSWLEKISSSDAEAVGKYAAAVRDLQAAMASGGDVGTEYFDRISDALPSASLSEFFSVGDRAKESAQYISSGLAAISDPSVQVTPEQAQNLKDYITNLTDATGYDSSGLDALAEGFSQLETTAGTVFEGIDGTELQTALQTAADSIDPSMMQGVGDDVAAGIGQGEAAHDFSGDAGTAIANDESALRDAAASHSPAQRFVPLGDDIGAGVGQGMAQHDFSADAAAMIAAIEAALGADQFATMGQTVAGGLAQGMAAADVSGPAAAVGASVVGAMGAALPASALSPTGQAAASGLAQGMAGFSFAGTCNTMSSAIRAGFSGLPAQGRSIGQAFGAGLSAGLSSRLPGIVSQAQSAANQIAAAFRAAWQIHSPSKVAENLTTMFGMGLERGMDKWPTVSERMLKNDLALAYGYAGSAGEAAGATTNNNNNSVNLNVDRLEVSDKQDARTLAYEIANLTRRSQRGYGKR